MRNKLDRDARRRTLAQIASSVANGSTIACACVDVGVSLATYYRWRRAQPDESRDPVTRVRELVAENARLRKLVTDLSLEAAVLRESTRRRD
jgi:putative transposase